MEAYGLRVTEVQQKVIQKQPILKPKAETLLCKQDQISERYYNESSQ